MSRDDTSLDWYHGKLSREDAENLLLLESSTTNSDGIFLVRESATSENSYVLSVYFDSEFYHYQIQQHSEDSFFSIDGLQPIHGIECLIDHYRKSKSNLCTQLGNFVKKSAPPIAIRRHGTSNLLHRATKKNQLTVVKEMMKTTYRNLDAKDESGMTAVHLACKYRCDLEILKLLIERGAAVSTRDSSGNTPLHYACESQSKEMVELLVNFNKNLIQYRNSETGAVPLHHAASFGNLEIVKLLLMKRAPPMPRTNMGLFPKDMAPSWSGVAEYLAEYKPPISTLAHKWNHGTVDRKSALSLLYEKRQELYEKLIDETEQGDENPYVNLDKEKDELISGLFLVRLSERSSGYVITMLHKDDVKNYIVQQNGKFLYIDDGPYMPSIEHLISHYMEFADGLPVALRHPVEPKPRPPVPLVPNRKSVDLLSSPLKAPSLPSPVSSPAPSESKSSSSKDSPSQKSGVGSWMNSLRKKKKSTSSKSSTSSKDDKSEKSKTEIAPMIAGMGAISFSTDNMQSLLSNENYDVPQPTSASKRKFSIDNSDNFTESDRNGNFLEADNCVEEIYFVDPPEVEKTPAQMNVQQEVDAQLYDTQKNLMREVNQRTGTNYYVSKKELELDQQIGSGEFGSVLQGILCYKDGLKLHVAVKTLHKQHYEENLSCFLREASIMIKLDNEYIVKLIGITKGPPIGLVQELLPLGSLADYLVTNADEIDVRDMHLWASQIARGMAYLALKKFVHRDLAARNILLASKTHCKISDFGLSRALGIDKEIYQSNDGGRWPVKWYAPEHVFGTFSTASDVWSFGITLWEIYTKGQQPYGEMTGSEVTERIKEGMRLEKPNLCPDDIYQIMTDCWQYRDKMRPNFQFLAQFFGNLLNTPEDNNNTNDIANGTAVADAIAEDNEHDEGEEQHLNEADVYHV